MKRQHYVSSARDGWIGASRGSPGHRAAHWGRLISLWSWIPFLSFATVTPAIADEAASEALRPRIGLVLGGGGARGAAHVGVLKVLEELRIPVDYVVGTSMGSVVGGLYACGMSAEEIEREIRAMDWDDLFKDDPSRQDRTFRRKRDDDSYAFKAKVGVREGKIKIPLAYVRGQKFDLLLNRLTLPVVGVDDFDQLPVPYRAVATDLETGKEVVLAEGNLARAIRASLAVPAAFDPVEMDSRLLVDGGLANNVPVSVARSMGADVFIVVDVGSGLFKRDEITNALDVTAQLTNFLFTLNTEQQLKSLGPQDVLITPPLGDLSGGDFGSAAEAIPIGESAAREAIDALRRYSVSEEDYARYLASRDRARSGVPEIDFVRTENRSRLDDAVIAKRITAQPGKPLDVDSLERDISRVYGLENFESVRYDVVSEGAASGLVVNATEKHWGPGFLQFGMTSSNDLQGSSAINLGAIYTQTAINSLNGEWRTGVQLGQEPGLFTEIHQPLDPLTRYFVYGKVGYLSNVVNVFDDAGTKLSEVRLASGQLELGAGREFGSWGEGRVGYRWGSGTGEVITGTPAPDFDVARGEAFARLFVDTFDSLYFPRSGHIGVLEWRAARGGLGANVDYDQVLLGYAHAHSWGANTVIGRLAGTTTLDDDAPLEGLFQLGGFLRLSGLEEDQLSGQHSGLATLVYMRRLLDVQLLRAFAGASLELGNVWQNSSDASLDNTIFAGSLFLGVDTPIGPLYIGYGRADTDDQSAYIYLGPRFTF
ncbi:MAG TPA: patatin-like phospholipase family protein [Steroidobacteraceae bacterium]